MQIVFPSAGNAKYSFYKMNDSGEYETVSSTSAYLAIVAFQATEVVQNVATAWNEAWEQATSNPELAISLGLAGILGGLVALGSGGTYAY